MAINVLVADDHPVVRSGLVSLLSDTDIEIVAEASTPSEAVKLAGKHKPDVVLLDVRMGEIDSLDALKKIERSAPKAKVVILSTYENPTYVARAAALGARDYMLKGLSRQEIISTIRNAAKGGAPSLHGEMHRVAGAMEKRDAEPNLDVPLTSRKTQVLRHLALGLSNKEIARSLEISVETVKEHVQNVMRKLQVTDCTQAAVWAVRRGLV